VNWTRQFALSSGLSLLFFLVLSNWLGLLPTAGLNLFACGALLVLVGLYAIRIGFLPMSLGLFLALFAIFADQGTIALGVPQLPSGIPDDYWFTAVLPPATAWFVFPLLSRLLAARLPRSLGGVAIGLALLPLPAIRFALRPEVIATSICVHVREPLRCCQSRGSRWSACALFLRRWLSPSVALACRFD